MFCPKITVLSKKKFCYFVNLFIPPPYPHSFLILRVVHSFLRIVFTHYTKSRKCPYSELFWSVFSRLWNEYGEIRSTSPYSVRMRKMLTKITPKTDTFTAVIEEHLLNNALKDCFTEKFLKF